MTKKYNTVFIMLIFIFLQYLVTAYFFTYRIEALSPNFIDFFFNMDSTRVLSDISKIYYTHYRITVHPLFLIFCQTIFHILKGIFINDKFTIIVIQSVLSTINVYILYRIIYKVSSNELKAQLLALIYGISFSSIVFTVLPETYIFAALGLLLLWYYVIDNSFRNEELGIYQYFILAGLGLLSYGITITNVIHFFAALIYLLIKKKSIFSKKIKDFISVIFLFILGVIILSVLQSIAFPNVNTFWEIVIGRIPNWETNYMDFSFTFNKLYTVLKSFFFYPVLSGILVSNGDMIRFSSYLLIDRLFIVIFTIYFVISLYAALKNNKVLTFSIGLVICANFCLHFLYGSKDTFLYSQHWLFLFFIIFASTNLSENKVNDFVKAKYLYILCICYIIFRNYMALYEMFRLSQFRYPFMFISKNDTIIITVFIVLVLSIIIFIYKIKLLKFSQVLLVIILFIVSLQLSFIKLSQLKFETRNSASTSSFSFKLDGFNRNIIYSSQDIFIENLLYPIKIGYNGELKLIDNTIYAESIENYNFKLYAKNNKLYMMDYNGEKLIYDANLGVESNFYIFGMGARNKYILIRNNNGLYNLLDYYAGKYIYKDIAISKIDSENYRAEGSLENKSFLIYEDNKQIAIKLDNKEYILDNSVNINIPKFTGKYASYLNTLFAEIMTSFDKNLEPHVNLFTGEKLNYREVAMFAMVCDKTNNLELIRPWIRNINKPYDFSNINGIQADNLGQILYLESLLEEPNEELIIETIKEANKLKVYGSYLQGMTDYEQHPIYQTAWLKFGFESLKYDSSEWNLLENIEDSYTDLIWFYNNKLLDNYRSNHNFYYASEWQQLNYARANFYKYDIEKDSNIKTYPISYRGTDINSSQVAKELGLYQLNVSTPNTISATEMFMYYYNMN